MKLINRDKLRLSAFIAASGFCSRRKAAFLIKKGDVAVNGKTALQPWLEIKEEDRVEVCGRVVDFARRVYIIFNKPKGVTTTLKDKFAARKITDFIPKEYGRVYPVGRLDKDSEGLIILTNDGRLCYELTHPKFEIEKEYELWVRPSVAPEALKRMKKGVTDTGDLLKVKSATLEATENNKTKISVVVSEGKKRHLRRLFARLGLNVLSLKRVRIGGLKLGNLKEGEFKIVDKKNLHI